MKENILSNFGLKVIAVLVAFLIWLMVINGDDPVKTETFRNVPVTVKNADIFMEKVKKVYKPRENAETGQEMDTVTVYVKARRSVLDRLSADSFTVTADFENIVEELNTIPLDIVCTTVPTLTMKDMWCDMRSFKVELEDVKDATFVVSTREEGTPESGYQVGKMEITTGESIAIAGPESDMKKIGKIILPVNVDGLKKSRTVSAEIQIYDKNEEQFTASQMERLTIKTLEGKVFKEDKLNVSVDIWKVRKGVRPSVEVAGTPAWGYRIAEITTAPETISVAGERSVLEELGFSLDVKGQVSAQGASATFSKEINLQDYLEESYGDTLVLEKDLSDLIIVTVRMEKIGTTTVQVPVADIDVKGKPEDMSYKLTPADNLTLEIQPESDDKPVLTAARIRITLNLSDEKYKVPGNYQVPLDIVLPDGYTLVSEPSIAVNLTRTEPLTSDDIFTEN